LLYNLRVQDGGILSMENLRQFISTLETTYIIYVNGPGCVILANLMRLGICSLGRLFIFDRSEHKIIDYLMQESNHCLI
jgi:hypothetical protein